MSNLICYSTLQRWVGSGWVGGGGGGGVGPAGGGGGGAARPGGRAPPAPRAGAVAVWG
jgi:hypothetical protein